MKTLLSCILLVFSINFLHSQQETDFGSLGFDLYGAVYPLPAANYPLHYNLHLGLSFKGFGHVGPALSVFGGGMGKERGRHFVGLGLQARIPSQKFLLKLEGGLVLDYEFNAYLSRVKRARGSIIPYYRLHLGYRFKPLLLVGGSIDYIPPTTNLRYSSISFPPVPPVFSSLDPPWDRHFGFSVFIGLSIP
ncbi:MAG: hypothetical protein R8P61_35565 [Bacteroidia bacterium]|nr:hypothetical protein [Bacteroidia bacterium]